MNRCLIVLLSLLLGALSIQTVLSQPSSDHFEFTAPVPDAEFVPPETSIILRPGELLESNSEELIGYIHVEGSVSGTHGGSVVIADDGETMIFTPDKPFALSEQVIIHVREGIRLQDGGTTESLSYAFRTSKGLKRSDLPSPMGDIFQRKFVSMKSEAGVDNIVPEKGDQRITTGRSSSFTPGDYPEYDVTMLNSPADGYIFVAPFVGFGSQASGTPYILILNNDGTPVFYRRVPGGAFDFKVQPAGTLTYFDNGHSSQVYIELDSTYTKIDVWSMKNGYGTDLHGIQRLRNGHALITSYNTQSVDMSQYVPGGDPNAAVVGYIVQEQDASHNVVFEWRSWDHFEFTDAADNIDLTASIIDYVHGNAVELDTDGNLMISNRHMDEITKINRSTGDIIWRLGGKKNQFTFINDTLRFSHQHDIRRLANGNISLFDNGNTHTPSFSRALEYRLDEENKTATLVWQYPDTVERYSLAMGNAQRLPNGNTMIGWGLPTEGLRKRIATEVTSDGKIAFELLLDTNTLSYRVFRFPWKGRSAAPYLWTEDKSDAKTDSVLLKMTVFGRDDIVKYHVYSWDFPAPEKLFDSTEGNTIVIRNLGRGKRYLYRAVGITDEGEQTEFSERLEFKVLPIGPIITLSNSTYTLPVTKVGTTREYILPEFFTNTGEEALVIQDIAIGGNNQDDFSVASMSFPLTILPGRTVDLTLDFTPAAEGRRSAELTVRSNAVNDSILALQVTGEAANASIAGKDVQFGSVKRGTMVDSLVVELIRNIGEVPIFITDFSISNPEFVLVNPPALPFSLLPDDSIDLVIRFAPADTGIHEGILIVSSDAEPNQLEIPLSGKGDDDIGIVRSGISPFQFSVAPVPANGETVISLTGSRVGTVQIHVIDMEGKVVRQMEVDIPKGSRRNIVWDGKDNNGIRCRSGRYVVKASSGTESYDQPIVLLW